METRNARYAKDGIRIDCELNHPKFGWIPFTADPDDVEEHGKAIFADVSKADVAPYVEPEPPAPVIPDRVTSRQFKMQLEKDGLLDSVEAWVGQQEKLVRIAYENSSTFLRTEPMMQAGFAAMKFDDAMVDAFYAAAASL